MDIILDSSLQEYFGFDNFRPGQAEAIQHLLSGQNTLVVMPTGSGKSLVYQFAAVHLPGMTLVVSPLVALMKDQVNGLERRGIPAAFINSSLTGIEQRQRLQELAEGKYRLVYVAPERLRSAPFQEALKRQKVSLLAVDEAHCISEWGHDFRPDYLHISRFRKLVGCPLTAALTATATPRVQDDIINLLDLGSCKRIVTGFNRPNLTFMVQAVDTLHDRFDALQRLLAHVNDGAVIIYVGTRRDAEGVAEFIQDVMGIKAQFYHAGLPPGIRSRIQDAFMSGDLLIIVATNAFGMGIDRPDVRMVVHYSLPGSLEAYYQEAGRAGRDDLPANAVLLYSPKDRALQEWFVENSMVTLEDLSKLYHASSLADGRRVTITMDGLSIETGLPEVKIRLGLAELERAGAIAHLGNDGMTVCLERRDWNEREIRSSLGRIKMHQQYRRTQLKQMIDYAESNACRREIILKHFGDTGLAEAEICCDNCQTRRVVPASGTGTGDLSDAERIALAILDAVRRFQNELGREKIAQILYGSKAKEIQHFGYNTNIYYSRLAGFSVSEIKQMIDQLLGMGYLKVVGGEYPVIRITPQGEAVVQNKSQIPLCLPRQVDRREMERKKAERQAGGTLECTEQLLSDGMSVEQVAHQRGLAVGTIYSHAARLIASGRISVTQVIPDAVITLVETAIRQVGSVEYPTPIKAVLPDNIEYGVIRCVIEGWKRHSENVCGQLQGCPAKVTPGRKAIQLIFSLGESRSPSAVPELVGCLCSDDGNVRRLAASALGKIAHCSAVAPLMMLLEQEEKPQVRQYAVKALGLIGDERARSLLEAVASNEGEKDYTRESARIALLNLSASRQPLSRVTNGED